MSESAKSTWQKLAESWVGIAPRDAHFESWMKLNLNPPLEGVVPAEWIQRIEADPRALSFARQSLRSEFKWESTWVNWMPNNPISQLALEPRESIERAILLTGALCSRELVARTILRSIKAPLQQALGKEVLDRLASRPAVLKAPIPPVATPLSWNPDPLATLRRSGILCLRIAISQFPPGLESRLAALMSDEAWTEPLTPLAAADSDSAMACIETARKLDANL
jgi:hypothetical protein